jgi:hypothetical protein
MLSIFAFTSLSSITIPNAFTDSAFHNNAEFNASLAHLAPQEKFVKDARSTAN